MPTTGTTTTTTPGTARTAAPAPAPDADDPREHVEVGVLLANGRLAGRRFATRADAERWARPEDGEQVVEFNLVCDCDM